MKKNGIFAANKKICNYFDTNLLPSFKSNAAIWTLKSVGLCNSQNGVTNNASESMNAIIRRLQKWNLVPVDVITNSFYQLCAYYHREIQRSIHLCGSCIVRDEYQHFQREPSLLPRMDIVPDPKDIVDIICNGCQRDMSSNIDSKLKANQSPNDSHISMAHCAIANNRVKLAEDGAWVVIGTDRVSHSAVRLFPKESCSCPSTTTCYHITACRLMVGLLPSKTGQGNLAEMQRKERRKKERPSGRKQPRRNDIEPKKRPRDESMFFIHLFEIIILSCR